ncbi:unnamed protein product [Symbiodinium sp. CCMP2592]|nr:unnamed protein product [Symbiodinium sp. CCMP2592]
MTWCANVNRAYVVCRNCTGQWIYQDRINKHPECKVCGSKWGVPAAPQRIATTRSPKVGRETPKPKWGKAGGIVRKLWDQFPMDVQTAFLAAGWQADTVAPPPGLSQETNGGIKTNDASHACPDQEAVQQLWETADPVQRDLLSRAGLEPPKEPQKGLEELCRQYAADLPPAVRAALASPVEPPKPSPKEELYQMLSTYTSAMQGLKTLIQKKAALQLRIDKAKATYASMLEDMKDMCRKVDDQNAKVEELQKGLQQQVPTPIDLHEPGSGGIKVEEGLRALEAAGVVLSPETKKAFVQALTQGGEAQEEKPVPPAQAELPQDPEGQGGFGPMRGQGDRAVHPYGTGEQRDGEHRLASNLGVKRSACLGIGAVAKFGTKLELEWGGLQTDMRVNTGMELFPMLTVTVLKQQRRHKVREEWPKLLQILQKAELSSMAEHERDIVEVVTQLEPDLEEGDLAHWLCDRMLDLLSRRAEDATGCVEACKDVIAHMEQGRRPSLFECVSANVTRWRSEVKQWMTNQRAGVAFVQETHLLEGDNPGANASVEASGYRMWTANSYDTGQGGSSGGVAVLAKRHLNFRLLDRFQLEGKGYVLVVARFAGSDVVMGSLYLATGQDLGTPINATILSQLMAKLQALAVPWIVAGDFNCDLDTIRQTRIAETTNGAFIGAGEATCSTGGQIDYVWAHRRLQGLVSVSADWEVPWRPHAALRIQLHWNVGQLPMLQVPRKPAAQVKKEASFSWSPAPFVRVMAHVQFNRATRWIADFSHSVEESLLDAGGQGRGWNLAWVRKPLTPQQPAGIQWKGNHAGYWNRLGVWLASYPVGRFPPGVHDKLTVHLAKVAENWHDESLCMTAEEFADRMCHETLDASSQRQRLAAVVKAQLRCATQLDTNERNQRYQEWLTQAGAGHMRPLWRALKTHEAKTQRPYQNLSMEVRSHARRAGWWEIWCAADNTRDVVQLRTLSTQVRMAAQAQAQQLRPINLERAHRKFRTIARKACGPDEWTADMLRALTQEAGTLLVEEMMQWEREGVLPDQLTMVRYTLLPKSAEDERPIGLTSYLYRSYCRLRWDLYAQWLEDYRRSALGPSPSRALVYGGSRFIEAEGVTAAPIRTNQGLIAGCPLAPGLSKIILHNPMQMLFDSKLLTHQDLWIDDIGLDVIHQSPTQAAIWSVKAFRLLKAALEESSLVWSKKKTVFVCTSGAAKAAVEKLRTSEDPPIALTSTDLGLDCGGGVRRRVTKHRSRLHKAAGRQKRLRALAPKDKRVKIRMVKGSLQPVGIYGHQATGVTPRRFKWLRFLYAEALGRMKIGSVICVLEANAGRTRDPKEVIMAQHIQAHSRMMLQWPREAEDSLTKAWQALQQSLSETRWPWQKVTGPLGAMATYLQELGWEAQGPRHWSIDGQTYDVASAAGLHAVVWHLKNAIQQQRWTAVAATPGAENVVSGIDWQAANKAVKHLAPLEKTGVQTLWQAALKAGPGAFCQRCQTEASLQHVLYDCAMWGSHALPPPSILSMQAHGCHTSLWLRGLPAKRAFYEVDSSVEIKGVWPVPDLTDVRFATDATGPKDPREGPVIWGVIAFRVLAGGEEGESHTGRIQVVGSITGAVSYEQTVFRGEAAAVCETVQAHPGEDELDITLDCEGVLRRIQRRGPGHSNRDLLDPVRAVAHRVRLTWVNSHLGRKAFEAKFGSDKEWRRQANCVVDELVKKRALRIAGPTVQASVRLWDKQVREVVQFLGQRVSFLLTADEADKAEVLFQPKADRLWLASNRGLPPLAMEGDASHEELRQRWQELNEQRQAQGLKPRSYRDFLKSRNREGRRTRLGLAVEDYSVENSPGEGRLLPPGLNPPPPRRDRTAPFAAEQTGEVASASAQPQQEATAPNTEGEEASSSWQRPEQGPLRSPESARKRRLEAETEEGGQAVRLRSASAVRRDAAGEEEESNEVETQRPYDSHTEGPRPEASSGWGDEGPSFHAAVEREANRRNVRLMHHLMGSVLVLYRSPLSGALLPRPAHMRMEGKGNQRIAYSFGSYVLKVTTFAYDHGSEEYYRESEQKSRALAKCPNAGDSQGSYLLAVVTWLGACRVRVADITISNLGLNEDHSVRFYDLGSWSSLPYPQWGGGSGLERLLAQREPELLRQLKARTTERLQALFEHFASQAGRFAGFLSQQGVAQSGEHRRMAPSLRLTRDEEGVHAEPTAAESNERETQMLAQVAQVWLKWLQALRWEEASAMTWCANVNRAYVVCRNCTGQWIYQDRINKHPECKVCGSKWGVPAAPQRIATTRSPKVGRETPKPKWGKAGGIVRKLWDQFPMDVQTAFLAAGWQADTVAPPPGLSQETNGGIKTNDASHACPDQEAVQQLWETADPVQRDLLSRAGLEPPKEPQKGLEELCRQYAADLPPAVRAALASPVEPPKPSPKEELYQMLSTYTSAMQGLKTLIQKKAALQLRIDKAKATYASMLEDMKDMCRKVDDQNAKVEELQKGLQQQVPTPIDLHEPGSGGIKVEEGLRALEAAGVVLSPETKKAFVQALTQGGEAQEEKPVPPAQAELPQDPEGQGGFGPMRGQGDRAVHPYGTGEQRATE